MIDAWTIQRVKEAANIVDVMQELGFDLKKKGTEYQCLCPFHADRHMGSFSVSPRKNIYHCFSCNAHGRPIDFLMKSEGYSFTEAIQWLGRKYGIEVEGSSRFASVRPSRPHTPLPPLPMLTIPTSLVKHTQTNLDSDIFVRWLRSLPWDDEQRSRIDIVLKNYVVGTAQDGSEFTIFWQIDEKGLVRTGKMLRYHPNGHRRKDIKYNSDWIHARLNRAKKYDPDKCDYQTCFFGQHLTDLYPNATINIVESEKTAIIMAIAYGQADRYLWLGCGGKGYINQENLQPFIDRQRYIVLYPDRDGVEEWREKARQITYDRLNISSKPVQEWWVESDGPKADIADIILRYITQRTTQQQPQPNTPPPPSRPVQHVSVMLQQIIDKNPAVQTLINSFNLTEDGH